MTQSPNSSRPSQALVVLSCGPVSVLESALHAILPTCRSAEVTVIVARVAQAGDGLLPLASEAGVDLLAAAPETPLRQLRREALARTEADIVTFIDDFRARGFPWSDLLLQRAGLVRPAGSAGAGPARVAH